MVKILIVGNVTKDVYLRLDERSNKFERDARDVAWLDLAFDGSSHRFYSRLSVFGGATVSLEVLSRFGAEAEIAGSDMRFVDGDLSGARVSDIYRYILCLDDAISYFSPSEKVVAGWVAPAEPVDWVYVDRSAGLSRKLAEDVLRYLDANSQVRLAFFASDRVEMSGGEVYARKLKERAELYFTDDEAEFDSSLKCVYISDGHIQFGGECVDFVPAESQDLMTHLTSSSIIAASFLGARARGESAGRALLLARANVGGASLEGTLSWAELAEIVVGEEHHVEKIK